MKIAILGAMSEEIELLLARLEHTQVEYAKNKFYHANYKNHELSIAYSKIGKVNSALTSSIMIEKFGAEILLFTGVAGAISDGFKIADMTYATRVCQHDLDISAFGHPFGYVPGNEIYVSTDANLNTIATQVATQNGVTLKPATIASGDQFICDEDKKQWINKTFGADVVEMEGASVGVVCDALGVPFFILRAISDEAGKKAEFDFDEFLIKTANLSADFILKMIEKI
jgi:MTA/SAH nucleosidase